MVTSLVKALDGFGVVALQTQQEPASAMSGWLSSQEPPAGFSIDRECELKASDDSKAVVRYAKHPLDIDEVRQHIESGKRPTRLAMTWDGRVSFELTDTLQLRKIVFLEGTLDGSGAAPDSGNSSKDTKDDNFDADAAIATGELGHLIPELLDALGGEMQLGAAPADKAPTQSPAPMAANQPADETAPF